MMMMMERIVVGSLRSSVEFEPVQMSEMDEEILQSQVSERQTNWRHLRQRPRHFSQRTLLIVAYLCCILFPMPSNQVPHTQQLRQITASSPSLQQQQQQQQQFNNNNQHPDAPKLIPLSALDRYQEGADLRLFCSASTSSSHSSSSRLQFEWRKNQVEQLAEPGAKASGRANRLHISLMDDDSASVLRINHLEADDSGNYTCLARNQHGFDSSTVRINVNVRLKWIREPPSELQVRAGKSVQLECDASGQPAPLISWTSLKDQQTIHSKVLRIDRVQANDSGLYECRAATGGQSSSTYNGHSQAPATIGEQIRKLVRLIVNGK